MLIPDANVLIYAVNADADRHREANAWLDRVLSNVEPVGFAWAVLLAFLRITTRTGLFPRPLTVGEAADAVEGWMTCPSAVTVDPTPRHIGILRGLLQGTGVGGNLVADAHLAALALEHGGTIVSYDADFGRFSGVHCLQPPPASSVR